MHNGHQLISGYNFFNLLLVLYGPNPNTKTKAYDEFDIKKCSHSLNIPSDVLYIFLSVCLFFVLIDMFLFLFFFVVVVVFSPGRSAFDHQDS